MSSTNSRMPSQKTMHQSTRLSIENEKPISYYFFNDSFTGEVCIATFQGDKLIFKSNEEHSSPIV